MHHGHPHAGGAVRAGIAYFIILTGRIRRLSTNGITAASTLTCGHYAYSEGGGRHSFRRDGMGCAVRGNGMRATTPRRRGICGRQFSPKGPARPNAQIFRPAASRLPSPRVDGPARGHAPNFGGALWEHPGARRAATSHAPPEPCPARGRRRSAWPAAPLSSTPRAGLFFIQHAYIYRRQTPHARQ